MCSLHVLLQTLFDSVRITTTYDVISFVLSQLISIGVVHGDPVCRTAAAVDKCTHCCVRNLFILLVFDFVIIHNLLLAMQ